MTKRVYDEAARAALAAEAGLGETTFTKADVLARPEEFKDTKYIFTTWGMPQFTVEEIKTYLPSLEAVFYGAGTVKMFAEPFMDAGVKIFSAWGANARKLRRPSGGHRRRYDRQAGDPGAQGLRAKGIGLRSLPFRGEGRRAGSGEGQPGGDFFHLPDHHQPRGQSP